MDASQWPQGIGVEHHNKGMEPAAAAAASRLSPNNNITSNNNNNNLTRGTDRPHQKDQPLNCPRCNSTNTKFCYYNNYSLSQPRYFCKTCRRYWTEGGSLRNVPVGGGSRKNKRPSSSSPSTSSSSSKKLAALPHHHQQHQDLNLGYPHNHVLPAVENQNPSPCSSSSPHFSSAVAAGGGGGMTMSSFLHVAGHDSGTMFAGGYPIQEFKPPTLNFSLEAFDHGSGVSGGGGAHGDENGARVLFPVEDLKQLPSTTHPMEREHHNHQIHHHLHPQATTGYWTGMLGGNSW